MIQVTPNAAKAIQDKLTEQEPRLADGGLRIRVEGGGCSGMQYMMSFDSRKPNDQVFRQHDVEVLIDPTSLEFIDGSTIDFVDGLSSTGFKILNPKAKQTCGCGTSFEA